MDCVIFANFSMRARLYAVLILVLLIGISGGIYWYFFTENTASLTVTIAWGEVFQVALAGTLDNENLPLADRFLNLKRDCVSVCTLSPIAPIRYTLRLTSPGKTTITDDIVIGVGEDAVRTYTFMDDVVIAPVDTTVTGNISIGTAIVANAMKSDTNYSYTLIWVDADNRVYTERESPIGRDIWILSLEKFQSLYRMPKWAGRFAFDITGKYLIAPIFSDKTLILSLDTKIQKELPIINVLGYVWWKEEKILTTSGVILWISSSYWLNPRFTDWLDISPTERLGYIDKSDWDKLSLSNLPTWESVLVRLDRITWQSSVIKRWVDMVFMFFLWDMPVYRDRDGKIWEIQL